MVLVFSIGTYSVLDQMIALWLTAAMVSYHLTLKATSAKGKLGGYALLGLACGCRLYDQRVPSAGSASDCGDPGSDPAAAHQRSVALWADDDLCGAIT